MRMTFRILLAALLLTAFLPCNTALAFGGPTAIIVDDETGEPIEGAIALAQWIKTKFNFEGGFTYVSKARETVSDKEGKRREKRKGQYGGAEKTHVRLAYDD